MDLVIEDGSRVATVYFLMSEDNVRKQMTVPWVSFASDAESLAPEGPFLKSNPHPRAYGTFARALGRYARDEKVAPLEDIVRRLTSLPATNLQLKRRGSLKPGYFADRRDLRPGEGAGPRDVREAAPVLDGRGARLRERRAGAEGRRAHGREARPRGPRARLDRVAEELVG